jgi:hypothetical protein
MCVKVYPPEDFRSYLTMPSVFLAGSIDMGQAADWQSKIEEALESVDCTVLNPRRKGWDSSWKQEADFPPFREQVEWELDAMESADLIAMHLDMDSKAPVSLLELGLHAHDGKMVVSCPDGYWRKGNVDIVCERAGVPVYEDFQEFVDEIVKRMSLRAVMAARKARRGSI